MFPSTCNMYNTVLMTIFMFLYFVSIFLITNAKEHNERSITTGNNQVNKTMKANHLHTSVKQTFLTYKGKINSSAFVLCLQTRN